MTNAVKVVVRVVAAKARVARAGAIAKVASSAATGVRAAKPDDNPGRNVRRRRPATANRQVADKAAPVVVRKGVENREVGRADQGEFVGQ